MIKLSAEATERHDLRTAWPMLLMVALLFALAFGFEMLANQVPSLRYTGALLLLNAYWAFAVYVVARVGWKKFPRTLYVNLIAVSLGLGKELLPHSFIASSFVQSVATLALFVSIAPRFFTIIRKTPIAAGENR